MENKPRIRLFIDAAFAKGAPLTISPDQSHYLVHVMRCREGKPVLVFNGKDGEWQAEISSAHKKNTQLVLQKQVRLQSASPDVWLVFAPVKNKNEVIIEKAVELGVSKLVPVCTRYTVVRSINEERLTARIIEAAEQCGRLDLPPLAPMQELENLLTGWDKNRILLFADERGSGDSFKSLLSESIGVKAVLIGPEGGFAPEEQALLLAQPFVKSFSLGPRILRADTAGIAALSCLMAWQGDWESKPCYPQLAAGSHTS